MLKPTRTPLPPGIVIHKTLDKEAAFDKKKYQRIIGSLLYLAMATRPDVTHKPHKLQRMLKF